MADQINKKAPDLPEQSDGQSGDDLEEQRNEGEQVEKSQVPSESKLGNALLRTFRSDINLKGGGNAKKLAERYLPNKGKPTVPRKAITHTRQTDEKGKKESIVRTYKQDVQRQVASHSVSMTQMAAMESDRRNKNQPEQKREPWKTTTLLLVGALFIVIGIVASFGMYFVYQSRQVELPPIDAAPGMIFAEARERIDITNRQPRNVVLQLALARRNLFFSLGSVVELYPTQLVETKDKQKVPIHVDSVSFLESIGARVNDTFLQTLGRDYMIGVHVIDESVPFLILTSNSYGHAFSGMFAWEQTIESDLSPFFSPSLEQLEQVLPAIVQGDNEFVDTVVQNLDVRILRDDNQQIRILYSFINRGTVVITTNIRTLIELTSRLRVQQ